MMLANSILNLSVETKVDRQQRETVKRSSLSNCETELSVQAECEPIVCPNSFAVCCTRNSWFPGSAHWEDLRKSLLFFSSSYFCHFCHGSSVWFSVSPAFHWRLMMSHWGPVEEARPHLPPRYVCISISLPPPPPSPSLPPSFLHAMAHTNHFICRLLDFPDAARLQPPSHADPAFYFAHTEQISGIKWPLVSADALYFIFIFLLARFCRKGLNVLKLAPQPPQPPADAELRGRSGWT